MSEAQIAPRTGDTIQLPISKLILDKENPRKSKSKSADPVMVGSIRSRGLLHNLGVCSSPTSKGKFVVKYGERRLRALRELTKNGHFSGTDTFDCKIVPDDAADSLEAQIAENICRQNPAPIDEYEAFSKLHKLGLSTEEIAIRFGADEKAVRQRLALGDAAPCVRKALRDEKISLEITKLFAGCGDIARQERVFKEMSKNGHFNAYNVRKALYQGSVVSTDDIALFVTLDAYETAGGKVERDLFSEEVRFLDVELLHRLRDEMLAAELERLTADGWSWVEAHAGYDYRLMESFDRIQGQRVEKTDEENEKIESLRAEQNVLVKRNADRDDWDDGDSDRYDEIDEVLSDLNVVSRVYTEAQMAVAGCIVYPGNNGATVTKGLVRKADRKKAKALNTENRGDGGTVGGVNKGSAAPYNSKLDSDLRAFRSRAIQAALTEHPDAAILFMHYTFVRQVLGDGFRHGHGTTIEAYWKRYSVERGDLGKMKAAAVLDRFAKKLRTDILDTKNTYAGWTAFCALNEKERRELVGYAVARTIEPTGGLLASIVVSEFGCNLRDFWTPTGENFFSRIKKDQLIAFLKDTIGAVTTAKLTKDYKAKKTELVDLCDSLIRGDTPVPPDSRKKLDEWTPNGMAFDTPEQIADKCAAIADDDVDDDDIEDDDDEIDGEEPPIQQQADAA